MTSDNSYYDANIYAQSNNLIVKAAYLYYHKGVRQQDIAEHFDISVSTVSRLLKKAKEQKVVRFMIDNDYLECIELENMIRDGCGLHEAIVAPLPKSKRGMRSEQLKQLVALEGARYLQRTVSDYDTVGVAYGETVWYVYNYLNPCQRKEVGFVTMHGYLSHEKNKLDGSWLVPRIAQAFGGNYYTINYKGILENQDALQKALQNERTCKVFEQFPRITVSISGVGMVYPERQSILVRGNYLSEQTKQMVEDAGACCDLMLRILDKNGEECLSDLRSRTLGIPLGSYKKIPNKIIVASGEKKTSAIIALLRNQLVNTLIIDQDLARCVCQILFPDYFAAAKQH